MQYDNIVSIGFTYPVVAGMLYDRNVADATTIAGYIRARHDGRHRSPWDEPECGLLYSRAMAGWNLFDQAAGFVYDATKGLVKYDPRTSATNFQCFCTLENGWGQYTQSGAAGLTSGTVTLESMCGTMSLTTLQVVSSAKTASADVDGHSITAMISAGAITFSPSGISLKEGSKLTVKLSGGIVPAPASAPACCPESGCCTPSGAGLRQRRKEIQAFSVSDRPQELLADTTQYLACTSSFQLFLRFVVVGLFLFLCGAFAGRHFEHLQ